VKRTLLAALLCAAPSLHAVGIVANVIQSDLLISTPDSSNETTTAYTLNGNNSSATPTPDWAATATLRTNISSSGGIFPNLVIQTTDTFTCQNVAGCASGYSIGYEVYLQLDRWITLPTSFTMSFSGSSAASIPISFDQGLNADNFESATDLTTYSFHDATNAGLGNHPTPYYVGISNVNSFIDYRADVYISGTGAPFAYGASFFGNLNATFAIVPAPEPGAFGTLCGALALAAGVFGLRRRRRN
jgi:hypothetical protein